MSQVKANGLGVFGVSEKKLEMKNIVKEEYIRNEWIDTVIQLPRKVNYHQNIVLIVRKNKRKTNQYIRMINSPTIFDELKLKLDKQKIDRIVKSVNNSKEYSGFVRNVPLDEIKESNNSLIPSRYVQKYTFALQDNLSIQIDYSQLEDGNTYRLSDVAKVYIDDDSKPETDLVIDRKSIYIDVTSKNISKDWLIEFIHSPVGKFQLNKLGLENIGNLRIPIIPVEKQKESIQKFNNVKQKVENVNASLDEVEKEINQRLYDSMGISDTFEIIDKKNLPD